MSQLTVSYRKGVKPNLTLSRSDGTDERVELVDWSFDAIKQFISERLTSAGAGAAATDAVPAASA